MVVISWLVTLVAVAALTACGPRQVEFEIADPVRRATLVDELQSAKVPHTVDDRGYVICDKTSAKRCNEIYEQWQARMNSGGEPPAT